MATDNYIDLFLNKDFREKLLETYASNKIGRSFEKVEINSQLRELFAWITSQVTMQRTYQNGPPSFDSIKNKELARCILEIASMGLSLNPRNKEAYLFIHYDNVSSEVFPTVKIGIQGMNQFFGGCSKIKSTNFSVVHEGDQFEWYGENTPPRFIYSYESDGNNIVAAFSVITFTDNTYYCSYIGTTEIQTIISSRISNSAEESSNPWIYFTSRCVRNVILRRTFNSLANILGLLPNNKRVNDGGIVLEASNQDVKNPVSNGLEENTVSDEDFAALLANQLGQ